MQLKVKSLNFIAGRPIAILHQKTANNINIHVGERILISKYSDSMVSIVDIAKDNIEFDEIGLSSEIIDFLNIREGDFVEVSLAEKPRTAGLIKKKLDGFSLEKEEIYEIIQDIVNNSLTEAEIAYFVSAVYNKGMTKKETEYLISAMVSTGRRINFSGEVVDKHSIGGIAGNRTTPLVISICAAAGLVIPKTSSRAITSAAGTADVLESITRVEFSIEELKNIVKKTNGCMVWNGILGLSPADDKLIQIERILNLDPEAQLLASVLSKKIAVGSKHVLIDIPYGVGAKVSKKEANILKEKFEYFGAKFGLNLKAVLTNGEQPIGNGIGPLLEIRDILKVLRRQNSPKDLENKSLFLAGQLLELSNKSKKGDGEKLAIQILNSGRALKKFNEIIKAQGGKVPNINDIEKNLAKFRYHLFAEKSGIIKEIDNKKINLLAKTAGSPMDKGSGIYLYKHLNDKVKTGEKILTIYSESKLRLENSLNLLDEIKPVLY